MASFPVTSSPLASSLFPSLIASPGLQGSDRPSSARSAGINGRSGTTRCARRRSRADRLAVHYRLSSIGARVQLLKGLLPSLGLLASLTLANGIFARFTPTRGQPPGISEEDLSRIRWRHVRDLARYVEQADPAILGRLDDGSIDSEARSLAPGRVRSVALAS